MNRITNEQREAIVRRAVAERDALLSGGEPERLSLTVADVLRIVDANPTRQEIERALIANLPSNAGVGASDGEVSRPPESKP